MWGVEEGVPYPDLAGEGDELEQLQGDHVERCLLCTAGGFRVVVLRKRCSVLFHARE